MGKALSTLAAYAVRPIKNYNVQSRAHKYIEIPKMAPKHPTTTKLLEEQARKNPQVRDQLQRKDDKLLRYLKDVYVTSEQIPASNAPELQANASTSVKRPLPVYQPGPIFGRESPENEEAAARPTPVGKISLLSAIKLLAEHGQNPQVNDVEIEAIVEKYRLEPEVLRNILHYYSTLRLFVPEASSTADADEGKKTPPVALPMRSMFLKDPPPPKSQPKSESSEKSEEKPK